MAMRVFATLVLWLSRIAALALAVITLITVLDVLMANLRGRPMTGVYEVVETSLSILIFLGLPAVFLAEQHITIDVMDHFVSKRTTAWFRSLGALFSLGFFSLMVYAMWRPAMDAIRFGDIKAEAGIPFWVLWGPILLGTGLSIVAAVIVMLKAHSAGRAGRNGQ
jgi:TRAP-type C4-dicarboxylate transport system permease small subunit